MSGHVDFARDTVSLAVVTNRMNGVVRKMTNTLFRTARSGVISSARDFSCCIVTHDGELLVSAESLPIQIFGGADLAAQYMVEVQPRLKRGDVFLHNSPYHGNSHAGDTCLVAPIVDDNGEHHFTVVVKAHLADIGNSRPTSVMPAARDVYEEGCLIFPCVKVQNQYEFVEDVLRMCAVRIRVPEMWSGDLLGMLGAIRVGERELLAISEELGWKALRNYTRAWFDYSEQRMAAALRTLPSGRVTMTSRHDPVPVPGGENGVHVEAVVDVNGVDGFVEVDLSGSADCVDYGINLTAATARGAALAAIFNSIDGTVPPNGGSMRRVRVVLRENCVAGIPRHPVSCSAATTGVADRVTGAVQRAIAELADGAGMADFGSAIPAAAAIISGYDPRHANRPFVNMLIAGMTAGAAHHQCDGWLTCAHAGNAGIMMRDSTEIEELLHPIIVWGDWIAADTEGAGRFRGAPSNYREYGPLGTRLSAMWSADGSVFPALGARGGMAGGTAKQYKRCADGSLEELGPWDGTTLEDGETIVTYSPAGGGYGPPFEREVARVQHDVLEGWISPERGEAVYGVVLAGDGSVDEKRTADRRAELRVESNTRA